METKLERGIVRGGRDQDREYVFGLSLRTRARLKACCGMFCYVWSEEWRDCRPKDRYTYSILLSIIYKDLQEWESS